MNGRIAAMVPTTWGVGAFGLLLAAYFALLTAVSGWKFTVSQFSEFWFYILPLAAGFGAQVALYTRLKQVIHRAAASRNVLAASGTTSTAAMASCCTHYLVNVAPVLGAAGLVAFAAQYQVELFWAGLAFNAAGIAFIATRLFRVSKEHAMAIDPVCGMQVDPAKAAGVFTRGSTRYYFCSKHCQQAFQADPDRYERSSHGHPDDHRDRAQ